MVSSCWRLGIITMLTATILVAVIVAYLSVFSLIGGAWQSTLGYAGIAMLACLGALWLARHRDELVEG